MKHIKTKNAGITLIALVITIVVLLILAGITINLTIGQDGIITRAQEAGRNYQQAAQDEVALLDKLTEEFDAITDPESLNEYNDGVNKPKLLQGMTPIKFTEPTTNAEGTTVKTTASDEGWYNYGAKNWANSQTEDGSMWVWIPRYAYKITYYTDDTKQVVSNTKTSYGSVDVKFLIGTTNKYYDENGQIKTAQRQTDVNQTIDTTADYTVHPAFTNEKAIGYANGGWRKELTGIWVAKFEAGYASGNNTAPVKASSVKYTEPRSWVYKDEAQTTDDSRQVARNWLDGVYSKEDENGTMTYDNGVTKYSWTNGEVAIKYPTFQGLTYSMNYINHNDSYNIARALTETGNIYGLKSNNADSHLMKNSEWGAVAYLSQSQYGLNGQNIYINNVNLNNTTTSVYALTGMAGNSADAGTKTTSISAIKNKQVTDVYTWKQLNGTKGSSTGTIYGIYDLSGGLWERTASLVYNGNANLNNFGSSLLNSGVSSEYVTIYPNNDAGETVANTASQKNYEANTKIYGDAVRETSTGGIEASSWYKDYSNFPGYIGPFFRRGGRWYGTTGAGLFYFVRNDGASDYNDGLRVVLVAQ